MPGNRYRVFIGPTGRRVFHAYARTKSDAFEILHQHINAMERAKTWSADEARARRMELLAHKPRVLKERFQPYPSGIHGPLFSCAIGSICTL